MAQIAGLRSEQVQDPTSPMSQKPRLRNFKQMRYGIYSRERWRGGGHVGFGHDVFVQTGSATRTALPGSLWETVGVGFAFFRSPELQRVDWEKISGVRLGDDGVLLGPCLPVEEINGLSQGQRQEVEESGAREGLETRYREALDAGQTEWAMQSSQLGGVCAHYD